MISNRRAGTVGAAAAPSSGSGLGDARLRHDNDYRGFEIYRDDFSRRQQHNNPSPEEEEEVEVLELDEIDMQHLAATAHPRLKSRCMHSDHVLIGLPTYTQVVKGDMEALLCFIQQETSTSVIEEFATRSAERRQQSYVGLMAVHARYRQATAALQRQKDADFELAGGSIPTNVHGLSGILDPSANRRQKHESQQVVRGLLSQPGLLKAPHRTSTALTPHNANTAKARNFQYEYQSHHSGDQEVPVDVYTAIGAKGGVWDGTVYKRTLVQSLFRKLRYKLYFDALHHHSTAKHHARLAVLSINARRMSKVYKLCFQSILHEFLLAKYTVSRAELTCNLHIVQHVHWPAFDKLHKNRSDSMIKTATKHRASRQYRMWYARKFLRLLRRKRNLRQFRELVLQISSLTRRGYYFKVFLRALKLKKEQKDAAITTKAKVDNLLVQRSIKAPLLAFAARTAVLAHLHKMTGIVQLNWSMRASRAVVGSWIYFTRSSKHQAKATDISGWQLLHRQGTLPMARWQMYAAKRRRQKLALARVMCLLRGERARQTLTNFKHYRAWHRLARLATKRAHMSLWSRSVRRGLQCMRRHALVCQWQRHAKKRARAFVRCAGELETIAILSEKAKLAQRARAGSRVADTAMRLRSQMQAVWVLQTRRASRGRAKSLHDWAPQHATKSVCHRAFSAWLYAFVRRSSMRAALEKRVANAGTIGPSSTSTKGNAAIDMLTVLGAGTDALQLQAGLTKLKEETLIRLSMTCRRGVRRLQRMLGEKFRRDAPIAPLAQERLVFMQQQLALAVVAGSPSKGQQPHSLRIPVGVRLHSMPSVHRSMQSVSKAESGHLLSAIAQQDRIPAAAQSTWITQPLHRSRDIMQPQTLPTQTGTALNRSGTRTYTDRLPAPMTVRGNLRVLSSNMGTSREHSSAAVLIDSSDEEDDLTVSHAFADSFSQEQMHNEQLQRESTLHKFFSHARTLPRSRKHTTADDSTSDYLTRMETASSHSMQQPTSQSVLNMPPPAPGAASISSLRASSLHADYIPRAEPSGLQTSYNISTSASAVKAEADASMESTNEQELSVAFSSFSPETSYAANATGALLDRSFELSCAYGGIEAGGFFYEAMTSGTGTKGKARAAAAAADSDDEGGSLAEMRPTAGRTDVGNSLDAATLLVEATHWSFRKLRRSAKISIATKRVRILWRRRHLLYSVTVWKATYDKLMLTMKLCHNIWSRGAVQRTVRQLRLCIKSTTSQEKSLGKRISLLRSRNVFHKWKRLHHLTTSEHIVRLNKRAYRLKHTLHGWIWCVRHIPGMIRLRKKMIRRVLYPVINHWKAKAKRLRKARTVFMLFERSWQQRWLTVYCRTEKSRLYECYDAWTHFVQIVKAERHNENMLQRALLFRSASLRAQCFMVWLDYHLLCLRAKRAKLAKLHMYQRVFMHTIQEEYLAMQAKAHHADTVFAKKMYSLHFSNWKQEAYKHWVLFPRTFYQVYAKRVVWKRLRMQRRVRVIVQELLPYQRKERLRKRFASWHRLYKRKVDMASGCTKLEHALLQMRQRAILQLWPGRAAFQKAERMREFMEEKGRSKVVLVNITEKETEERKSAIALQKAEEKNRSFLSMRQAAPLERRAALFGMIYSAEDAEAVEDLFGLLRAVLYAWQDQAHTDAFLRGSERLVRFRHKRALLEQSLRIWLGRCSVTSHRLALWISKKFSTHANKKLNMSKTAMATKHLVEQYAKLGLDDMVGIDDD